MWSGKNSRDDWINDFSTMKNNRWAQIAKGAKPTAASIPRLSHKEIIRATAIRTIDNRTNIWLMRRRTIYLFYHYHFLIWKWQTSGSHHNRCWQQPIKSHVNRAVHKILIPRVFPGVVRSFVSKEPDSMHTCDFYGVSLALRLFLSLSFYMSSL